VAEEARRVRLIEPPAPDPGAVIAAFRLPGAPVAMTPVAGAWSNRVYRLETTAGTYAVKELLDPWGERRLAERIAEAWQVELAAIAAGVAAPEPVAAPGGGPVVEIARAQGPDAVVRVHRWAHGVPAGTGPVTAEVAAWAGGVLARLHGMRLRPRVRGVFPVPEAAAAREWPRLADAAARAAAPWAPAFRAVQPDVEAIARLVRAGGHRPGNEVMSHADIDQKNVLLGPSGPLLCDWDVAGPVVPRRELADVALSLAGWASRDIARVVVRAYGDAGGEIPAFVPEDLGAPLATSLDWIVLNAEVALGVRPAPPGRRRLAGELLPGLLADLPRHVEAALDVSRMLTVPDD
jgi:Ser/Thr protein kinase RdoA (MazF antagonist)